MATTPDPTAYLVGDLIANAIADLADAPSRISEFLAGEDDVPAPGPERDALITEITARLGRIADADLAELLDASAGQETTVRDCGCPDRFDRHALGCPADEQQAGVR